jgi:hypothetical protein
MGRSTPLLRNSGRNEWYKNKTYTVVGFLTIGLFLTISSLYAMSPKYSDVLQPRETFSLMQGSAARSSDLGWVKKGLGRTLGLAEGHKSSNSVTAAVERHQRSPSSGFALEQKNILKQHAAELSKVGSRFFFWQSLS